MVVYYRRAFPMYPYFALCLRCWGIGKVARTRKQAAKNAVCTCERKDR